MVFWVKELNSHLTSFQIITWKAIPEEWRVWQSDMWVPVGLDELFRVSSRFWLRCLSKNIGRWENDKKVKILTLLVHLCCKSTHSKLNSFYHFHPSLFFPLSRLPLPLTLPLGHSNLAKAAANCPDPWPRWQHNDRDRWQSWIIGAAGFYSEMKVREGGVGGGGVKAVREKETGETDTVTVLINRSLAGRRKTCDDPRSTFCCSRVIKDNIYWTEPKREQMLCCVSPGRWSRLPGLNKKKKTKHSRQPTVFFE